jgi:hypothetical protein
MACWEEACQRCLILYCRAEAPAVVLVFVEKTALSISVSGWRPWVGCISNLGLLWDDCLDLGLCASVVLRLPTLLSPCWVGDGVE